MSKEPAKKLGEFIRQARVAKGLTLRALGEAVGMDYSVIAKLELGNRGPLAPQSLQRLARTLSVDLEDLYALAGYSGPEELPSLVPYLRAKSGLPDEAIDELAAYFSFLETKYGKASKDEGGRDGDNT